MKKITLICLILVTVLAFSACTKKASDKVIGTWKLSDVEGEQLSDSEKSLTIEFKSDGTALNSKAGPDKPAKWEMPDEKTMLIKIGDREERWSIEKLDDKDFVVIVKGEKLTLTRQ